MIRKAQCSILVALAACGSDRWPSYSYEFGPFHLDPGQEVTDLCVAVTLHNTAPLYVSQVEMHGGAGIHHSNWFWVPDNDRWSGFPEGAFSCAAGNGTRPFDQQIAASDGGVLFAQSTQVSDDVERFPPGYAIRVGCDPRVEACPAGARIIADVHLLNTSDGALDVPLELTLSTLPAGDVQTELHGFAMENFAIALPPQARSRFDVACDLADPATNMGPAPWSFHIVHALAHYHKLGVGLTFEAVRDGDGGVDTIWSTSTAIGQELGAMLDPPFDMTGHSLLRLSCSYDNVTDHTVVWGNGDGEMCIAFAYTDSPLVWTAGIISTGGDPGPSTTTSDGVVEYSAPASACTAVHVEAN